MKKDHFSLSAQVGKIIYAQKIATEIEKVEKLAVDGWGNLSMREKWLLRCRIF